jgi:hypothetical protein
MRTWKGVSFPPLNRLEPPPAGAVLLQTYWGLGMEAEVYLGQSPDDRSIQAKEFEIDPTRAVPTSNCSEQLRG